jgi:translation elongation factor EF-1alpha
MTDIESSKKFVVVGHVDHGKSTLCGHILYKSGYVDEHKMDELRKKADANKKKGWEYAYILDIFEEEQARGKTMDYANLDFKYGDKNYTLIDTPGHKHLIRTLISGLNHYNTSELVGCLMISCVENEFLGGMSNGQTKEDVLLLRASGVENLIVLINKMDLIDWNVDIYNKYKSKLEDYIKKLGFKRYEFMPISGYTGKGIDDLFKLIDTFNFDKKSLTDTVVERKNYKEIVVQLKILYNETFDKILTSGSEGILHIGTTEYEVAVSDFKHYDVVNNKIIKKTKGNNLMQNGDIVLAKLRVLSTDDNKTDFTVALKDRVIFRKEDWTIAFGRVSKLN